MPVRIDVRSYRSFVYAFLACTLILELAIVFRDVPRTLAGYGDFVSFYRPALMIRSGDAHGLYRIEDQFRYERKLFPEHTRNFQLFYHPPYEAVPIIPFTFLSYKTAYWLWCSAGILALILGAWVLAPGFPNLRRAIGVPIGVLSLCYYPVLGTVLLGQDALFLFCVLALAYREFCLEHDVAAGMLLGCALFKFQYVVPLVFVIGLLRWRPKLLLSCGAVAAVLTGFSWWLVGTQGAVAYVRLIFLGGIEENWRLPNLRGLLLSLGGNTPLVVALSALLAISIGLAKYRTRQTEFSAALLAAALVSFHMHVYDMTILLIPLAVCIEGCLVSRDWPRLLLPGLFFFLPMYAVLVSTKLDYLLALPVLALLLVIRRWTDSAFPGVVGSAWTAQEMTEPLHSK